MQWVTGAASAAMVMGGAWVAVVAVQQPSGDRVGPNSLVVTVGGFELEDYLPGSEQLSNGDREKATRAALAIVGPGRVTEVERDEDAGSTYQVELRLQRRVRNRRGARTRLPDPELKRLRTRLNPSMLL